VHSCLSRRTTTGLDALAASRNGAFRPKERKNPADADLSTPITTPLTRANHRSVAQSKWMWSRERAALLTPDGHQQQRPPNQQPFSPPSITVTFVHTRAHPDKIGVKIEKKSLFKFEFWRTNVTEIGKKKTRCIKKNCREKNHRNNYFCSI
jgi:hypothetical protein